MQNPIVKRIAAVLAGFVVFFIITMLVESASGMMYPMPAGLDFKNTEAVKAAMMNMPTGAYLLLIAGYALASFAGGFAAVFVAKTNLLTAIIVGVGFLIGGILNFVAIPHPMWVVVVSCICYLLFAWAGGRYALHHFVWNQKNIDNQ